MPWAVVRPLSRWQTRFAEQRLAGLFARHQGGRRLSARRGWKAAFWPGPDARRRIVPRTWSSRKLARALAVNHMMVARVWQCAGLKPRRLERYMASDDPDFERKADDLIGLYVDPPQHAAVFASMRRPPSKRSIASTRCCRLALGEPNATASSTIRMARFRSTLR
jgi:hypothetical protein